MTCFTNQMTALTYTNRSATNTGCYKQNKITFFEDGVLFLLHYSIFVQNIGQPADFSRQEPRMPDNGWQMVLKRLCSVYKIVTFTKVKMQCSLFTLLLEKINTVWPCDTRIQRGFLRLGWNIRGTVSHTYRCISWKACGGNSRDHVMHTKLPNQSLRSSPC